MKTNLENIVRNITENIFGSGFDYNWKVYYTKRNIVLCSSFHCLNERDYYDGWQDFKILIPKKSTDILNDFKIKFIGNNYLSRKYSLREYIDDVIVDCINNPNNL